jgi:hypothetical protein
MQEPALTVPFAARGHAGTVFISMTKNNEPAALGCQPWAEGFPVCSATIEFAADGYAALLGWVQLVRIRSSGPGSDERWVTDPLELFEHTDSPFGFFGIKPTLFDAPARSDTQQDLDWHAESFLCFAPSSPMAREAMPIAAFSWGFVLANNQVELRAPEPLPLQAWTKHLDLLRSNYPNWTFLPTPSP